MDVDGIRIGNWRKQTDQSLANCAAVLVVIGPQWLAALEQRCASDDQVRYEIAQALLLDKIIIPVAVDRARLPHRRELPEDIAALYDAQGYELGVDVMWRPTVGKLLDDLSDLLRDVSTTECAGQAAAEPVTLAEAKSAQHETEQPTRRAPEIFISYVREDADAAARLRHAITQLGGNVWLDERRWLPGDAWENEILTTIRRAGIFIPVISANTEREEQGFAQREWREAIKRSRAIPDRQFIVPVIVDDDEHGPSHYRHVPDDFRRLRSGHAPGGEPDAGLLALLTSQIRAMRRTDAP